MSALAHYRDRLRGFGSQEVRRNKVCPRMPADGLTVIVLYPSSTRVLPKTTLGRLASLHGARPRR